MLLPSQPANHTPAYVPPSPSPSIFIPLSLHHKNTTTPTEIGFVSQAQDTSAIQQIAFGVIGLAIAIGTIYLGYLQLQRMRIHPSDEPRADDFEMNAVRVVSNVGADNVASTHAISPPFSLAGIDEAELLDMMDRTTRAQD
ncbi:hypothetical protein EJ08DRAFT_653835 [Tothia fuscella]|uniref:Transmembrane protein n=1 Tax=Tothia fuscella TaxID=1048955 RepID=A0A9P4NGN6_9PEZI|nr:hypothetical protein EJ08DRAFT_653835 [Tothia fuscella]